jgi:aspartate aminotransferase
LTTTLPLQLARGFPRSDPSAIREIANASARVPGAIRLDVGDPDIPTPSHIARAGCDAIEAGDTKYTATQGYELLRYSICRKLERVNGIHARPDQVVCSTGSTSAIAAALAVTVNPGDEVLIPDPCWPNYLLMATLLGIRAARYPCPRTNGYIPHLTSLEERITPRTRAILVNSPNNPTGAVYPANAMRGIVELALRRGLWIISDESYDQITFGPEAVSPATIIDDGRVISCFTFSKTYSMTGWRLGYAVSSPTVAESMVKALQAMTASPSSIAQRAGQAALDGPQECVATVVQAYRFRRDSAVDILARAGLLAVAPSGTMYVLADVSPAGPDSREFALRLLHDRQVSVAPGAAFGDVTEGTVRISLVTPEPSAREGIERLVECVQSRRATTYD